jgi:hypothetical protein
MDTPTLQERRRLNDAIERAFIEASVAANDFEMWKQTDRGMTLIDLYERFYSNFNLLVMLTSVLQPLRQSQDQVKKARMWLNQKIQMNDDKRMETRFNFGVIAFMEYAQLVSDQGLISLPSSGRG